MSGKRMCVSCGVVKPARSFAEGKRKCHRCVYLHNGGRKPSGCMPIPADLVIDISTSASYDNWVMRCS